VQRRGIFDAFDQMPSLADLGQPDLVIGMREEQTGGLALGELV